MLVWHYSELRTLVLRLSQRPKFLASFQAPGFKLFYMHSSLTAADLGVSIGVHGWLVLELSNDSAIWVGVFALFNGMGQFFSSMLAGAIVDRFQRRNVLLIQEIASTAMVWGLATATFFEVATLPMAIGLAFVIGCIGGVRFTAANRFVYDLVGPQQLVNGVSWWRISSTPITIIGALLVGGLIEWIGIWAAYGFLGVISVFALPPLAMIRVRGSVERVDTNLLSLTVEGIRYGVKDQTLRTLFTMSIAMEALGFGFLLMIPVMAKTVLNVGGIGMGMMQAGVGAGAFIATLTMAARGDSENKPRVIFLNVLVVGVALIGFALSRSLILSIILTTVIMAFMISYDITLGALMQLVSPPHIRGRAVGLHSLATAFFSLGGFVMGAVGGVIGVPVVLVAAGVGVLVNAAVRRPALMRIQERPTEVGDQDLGGRIAGPSSR